MKFVEARFIGKQTVRYKTDNGELVDYIGGTWAWRNNNPGNIIKSTFAIKNGAIGSAGGFAVFPDYKTGAQAQVQLLKLNKYQQRKIWEIIQIYAPSSDGNDPQNYTNLVKKFTGIDPDKRLKDLNEIDFNKVIQAIIKVEGFKVGQIIVLRMKKILNVKIENEIIVAYEVEEYGWLDKKQALEFTKMGLIDAVIVTTDKNIYLRSRPDETKTNNLKE